MSAIKVRLVDNSSEVDVGVGSGAAINLFKEALKRETKERIAADEHLQEEIDSLVAGKAAYLLITENKNGSIDVSLLNEKEEVLDTKTITLTEKLIKNIELDYETGNLVFTHFDDTISTCDINAIKEALAAETARAEGVESELRADLTAETERAESAETTLQENIEAETARAEAAEEALGHNVEEETARAKAAEATLQENIEAETSRAEGIEAGLRADLTAEISRAEGVEHGLRLDLNQEIQDRIAAVEEETERAEEAETNLGNALQDEVDRATAAEGDLDDKIEAEITRAQDVEDALDSKIDNEITRAEDAEATLQDNIDAEASTRASADNTLQSNIDAEKLARIAADETLQDNIDAEATARYNADVTLQGNIDVEEAARIAGDIAINNRISALDLGQVGQDGKYIKFVSQLDGQVSASTADFDTAIPATENNPSNITAPTTKAVRDAIDALNKAEEGQDGYYIKKVKEEKGIITATKQQFDQSVSSSSQHSNVPSSKAVWDLIGSLDVGLVGSDGSYLKTIVEENGKITATPETFDTSIPATDASPSNITAPTTKAVRDAIDNLTITDITNTVGKTITKISEQKGIVSAEFTDIQIAESQVTNLETDLATLDNKLNYNVHLEGNTDEITYNGDTVTKTSPYRNLKTGATGSRSENIHLANTTTAGLMSHNDYNTIVDLVDRVASLEGTSVRITYSDSDTPTAAQIKAAATDYLATRGITDPTDADYNGVSVRVTGTNHLWNYYANLQAYRDDGLDTVTTFTNSIAGIIKGAGETDGSIYAENDGTGSVYGWDALKTRVTNAENTLSSSLNNVSYDSTNKKLTKTTNAGTTADIVNLGINTSTGDETVTVNTDTLNVVTRDTAQEISGAKTFIVGITAPSIASASGTLLLGLSGQSVQTNGNLIPDQTNYRDLGNVNRYWQNLYLDGSLKLKGSSTTYNILVDDTYNELRIQNGDSRYFTFNSSGIMPAGTRNLGSISYKWQDIFISSTLKNNNATYGLTLPDMTSWMANKTIAVKEDLNLSEVGADGSYIKLVSQTDGQLAATSQTFDTTIPQTGASTINAPTTAAVVNYVDTYGGKIDSISLDGTALTIDQNKNVDIPVSLTTTVGSEAITVNSDSLNVVTIDTNQTITGVKTFNPTNDTKVILGAINNTNNKIRFLGRNSNRYYDFGLNNSYNFSLSNAYSGLLLSIGEDGGVKLKGTTSPIDNNSSDLGTDEYRWKDLYLSGQIKLSNNNYINSQASFVDIYQNNARMLAVGQSGIYAYTSIIPGGDNRDLGSTNIKWRDIYLYGKLRDGNNSNYGLILPDTTSYIANKTIATIEDINTIVLSYADTMEILTSAIMPAGTTVENNNVAFPEGVTVSNHNINL